MLTSSSSFNPVLSQLAQEFYFGVMWVGNILAPMFRTGEQSAQYPVFDKENLANIPEDLQRAPGTPYSNSGLQISDDTYFCEDRGHVIIVDETQRKKYRSQFDADTAAIRRGLRIMKVDHERRVKAFVDSGSVTSSAVAKVWTDPTSDPIGDVKAQRLALKDATGVEVNTWTISRAVAEALWEHPQLIEKFKYSKSAVLTNEDIERVFRIPSVVIADERVNSAPEGLSMALGKIWGDDLSIFSHSNQGNDDIEVPNALRTFVWTEDSGSAEDIDLIVESKTDWDTRSDHHRVRHNTGIKQTGVGFMRKLTNVV